MKIDNRNSILSFCTNRAKADFDGAVTSNNELYRLGVGDFNCVLIAVNPNNY